MKKFSKLSRQLAFSLIFCLSISQISYAQDCITVTLSSQAEVNAFTCSSVWGLLTISGEDIIDLSPLSVLTSVGGLNINRCPSLTNLDGLSSLTSIRGELWLERNNALTNIDGLSNLTSVGYIFLYENLLLTDIDAFSNLTSLSWITINDSKLTNLNGLSSLTSVSGQIRLNGNFALTNLDGLSNLTYIGGDLNINTCGLTNLDGLSNLTTVGALDINSNSLLTDINGLSNIRSVTRFVAIGNSKLTNFDGLSNLTSVGSNLYITYNKLLTNVDGLSNLTSVGGYVNFTGNRELTEFCGLYSLINGGGLVGSYTVSGNAVNPTQQEIIDAGPCIPLNNPPLAVCRDLLIMTDANCHAIVSGDQVDNGSSDPDGDPLTFSLSPEGPYNLGETPVVLTVSDGLESAECTATITVVDLSPPEIIAPASVTIQCDMTTDPSVTGIPTATDNCDGNLTITYSDSELPGTCSNERTINRTWVAVDASGNASTAEQTITLVDDVAPQIAGIPLGSIPQGTDPGQCGAVINYPEISATDNCSGSVDLLIEPASGTFFPVGRTTVNVTATDACGNSTVESFEVIVTNNIPEIISISASLDPMPINTIVNATAEYSDNNLESAHWDWGDGSSSDGIIETEILGEHSYSEAGVYTVSLTLSDHCGESASSVYQYIVIYDPEGGFVTGGGWINSPVGASIQYPDATGKANFGFVSKYDKKTAMPIGNTEFQFKAGNLNFNSYAYDWLVIASSKAMFKGTGTINSAGNYKFLISAIDGDLKDEGDDRFRIKIWEELFEDVENVIYDNQVGASENEDPSTPLGGGSIVIHTNDNLKDASVVKPGTNVNIYPNPFEASINLDLLSESSNNIIIDMIDMNGRIIEYLYTGVIAAEVDHHFEFNMKADLTPGSYILRITTEKGELLGREIIIRR